MTLQELLAITDKTSSIEDEEPQNEDELVKKIKEEYLKRLIKDSQVPRTKAAVFGTRG